MQCCSNKIRGKVYTEAWAPRHLSSKASLVLGKCSAEEGYTLMRPSGVKNKTRAMSTWTVWPHSSLPSSPLSAPHELTFWYRWIPDPTGTFPHHTRMVMEDDVWGLHGWFLQEQGCCGTPTTTIQFACSISSLGFAVWDSKEAEPACSGENKTKKSRTCYSISYKK